jgi:outer membrane protein OmpA-like peptidoglycan-associated protein
MKTGGSLLTIGLLLALSGCAHTGVTMFAGEKGEHGSIAVLDPKTGADLAILDQANSRTAITNGKPGSAKAMSADRANLRYGGLLSDVPEPPKLFVLYFREGSTDLVDESNSLIPELFQEMKRRAGVDIQLVGHTDTVGDAAANDALSVQRAKIVEEMLVKMGMSLDIMRATGRGEREPLEPTGDNVASVFNRRVEVYIK